MKIIQWNRWIMQYKWEKIDFCNIWQEIQYNVVTTSLIIKTTKNKTLIKNTLLP